MIKRQCKKCKKEFFIYPSRKHKGEFCSKKCWYAMRIVSKKSIETLIKYNKSKTRNPDNYFKISCNSCKKVIEKAKYRLKMYRTFYCSHKCQYKSMEKYPEYVVGLSGSDTKMRNLHVWIKRRLPKPEKCQECKKASSRDLANISQLYTTNLSDWEWLCRKCHMIKDGRIRNAYL